MFLKGSPFGCTVRPARPKTRWCLRPRLTSSALCPKIPEVGTGDSSAPKAHGSYVRSAPPVLEHRFPGQHLSGRARSAASFSHGQRDKAGLCRDSIRPGLKVSSCMARGARPDEESYTVVYRAPHRFTGFLHVGFLATWN